MIIQTNKIKSLYHAVFHSHLPEGEFLNIQVSDLKFHDLLRLNLKTPNPTFYLPIPKHMTEKHKEERLIWKACLKLLTQYRIEVTIVDVFKDRVPLTVKKLDTKIVIKTEEELNEYLKESLHIVCNTPEESMTLRRKRALAIKELLFLRTKSTIMMFTRSKK